MRALGIDTTRRFMVIVLIDGENTYTEVVREGNKKHNSLLLERADGLLAAHKLTVSDMDCFSAVTGPGSFTGIRVGVATVNGFAYALKKPLAEVTALELIAYNKKRGTALIDALHGNYYGGTIADGAIREMRFYEADEKIDGEKYFQDDGETYADAFAALIRERYESGCMRDMLSPLYMRASQAEREADKNA